MLHGHGGNISAVARRFGLKPSEIIDMSSNDCSNFSGLTDRYIRISLKTPEVNKMAAHKLRSFALEATSESEAASDRRTPQERQVA